MTDTLITLPGRIARLCQEQRLLSHIVNEMGEAIVRGDWAAVDGFADQVVELGNDIGMDAYMLDKADRSAVLASGTEAGGPS